MFGPLGESTLTVQTEKQGWAVLSQLLPTQLLTREKASKLLPLGSSEHPAGYWNLLSWVQVCRLAQGLYKWPAHQSWTMNFRGNRIIHLQGEKMGKNEADLCVLT